MVGVAPHLTLHISHCNHGSQRNNVALVTSCGGHKLLESFNIYLHVPEQSCILTDQRIASVGLFLASFAGIEGTKGTSGTDRVDAKALELKEVAL